MNKIGIIFLFMACITLFSCDKMDDNYREYLDMQRTYSPKVRNLTAVVGLKSAILNWENPQGDIARQILVDYQDSTILFDTLVNTVSLQQLEIKGYNISVYTIDAFGNHSVPETIQIFPNGENN